MDDTPQGGAGGVPLHHENARPEAVRREEDSTSERPRAEEQPEAAEAPHTVRTVRAGKPVGEQATGARPSERED
ncbi:hypothetical protein [Kitasatospora sp. NPDC085464]|uniref:hypothetical protein n=1 Tax=Kitasatospora sp. NPDC085464 TaxID=3364063 RepID=UPI0037C97F76